MFNDIGPKYPWLDPTLSTKSPVFGSYDVASAPAPATTFLKVNGDLPIKTVNWVLDVLVIAEVSPTIGSPVLDSPTSTDNFVELINVAVSVVPDAGSLALG